MKNIIKMSLATAVMMSVGTLSAQAAEEDGISVFDNIKVKGEIRPRYEMVDTDNNTNNANALTNRLMLGVNADLFGTDWLSTYIEMTDVHSANSNYYDGTGENGTAGRAPVVGGGYNTVVDPEQTRLTQSYLDFKYNKTLLRAGRQMVNLDNQRFVGAVGWRQMPQTFNAYALVDNSIENLNLMAAYVTQVNTIKAGDADSASTETVLLNAKYKVMDALTVTGYGYLVENFADTYGLALTGKPKLGDGLTLNYRAEYAMMTDASFTQNPTPAQDKADADYINLELGVNMNGILAGIGYELQSGASNNDASTKNKTFSTPLGTNHGHNGWADLFLTTPDQGLVDLDIMVGYKSQQLGVIKAIYHDFSSDEENYDYGTEFDLLYKRAIPGVAGLTGMVKYANYSADISAADAALTNGKGSTALSVDTQKLWVMLTYKFSN